MPLTLRYTGPHSHPRPDSLMRLCRRIAGHYWTQATLAQEARPPLCFHGFAALEPRIMLSGVGLSGTEHLAADAAVSSTLTLFDTSPALFVENQGQWEDKSIRFVHFGSGANVLMTDRGPQFQVFRPVEGDAEDSEALGSLGSPGSPGVQGSPGGDDALVAMESLAFSASFLDAAITVPIGVDASQAAFNYFVGDVARHRADVASFERIVYPGLYEGIDLHTWGQQSNLKYEFHVAPGSDYQHIQVQYHGVERLALAEDGSLVVHLGEGWEPLVDAAPYVYQEIDGQRFEIESRYVLLEGGYTFALGAYDPAYELVIDPQLAWSSYLGGSGDDDGYDIAVDASGAAWVTGYTRSTNFPTTDGLDVNHGGSRDAFVMKLNADGSLAWSSYLGGSGDDDSYGIALDASGAAWVAGLTSSDNFPATEGLDTSLGGPQDGFVTKINADGTIAWSRYLGGSDYDNVASIAVDASGAAWVTGATSSDNFPASDALDTSLGGTSDAFVTKVNADGSLAWSRYLGGSGLDAGTGIAVDPSGAVSVTGYTDSSDLATDGSFDTALGGLLDAFVARVNANGTTAWSSYLGGSQFEFGNGVAVDDSGAVWVTGETRSDDFPTSGSLESSKQGVNDAFVTKFNANGTLAWSRYLGGSSADYGHGIAVDASGAAWVVGDTLSTDFAISGVVDGTLGGSRDAFVTKIDADGTLAWSQYIGGSGDDYSRGGIAVDGSGRVWMTGRTNSDNFPVEPASGPQTTSGGGADAFVARISPASDLSGTLWHDLDGDGEHDATEDPFSESTVYIDANNNGVLDWTDANANSTWDDGEGERWTFSDAAGDYRFDSLADGEHVVRPIVPARYRSEVRTMTLFGAAKLDFAFQNPAPSADDVSVSLREDIAPGTPIGSIVATDPGDTLTYAIIAGNDDGLYAIDAATGIVTLVMDRNLDFESDSSDILTIQVTDLAGHMAEADLSIDVTNVNDAPELTSATSFEVAENTTAVATLTASDQDAGTTLSYSIVGGVDGALFEIDASTAELTFRLAPDFEAPEDHDADNSYDVQVQVRDNGDPSLTVTQTLTITVTDVHEAPVFPLGINVPENTTEGITTAANDPDDGATLAYSIIGGADKTLFSIDSVTGELSFIEAPNFEAPVDRDANNIYIVHVQADDGEFKATQALIITITNVNEAPELTSATSFSIAENTTAVATLTAADPDADTTFSYSILGGMDAALFAIDANTGELTFKAAPDFEAPADHDTDNTYQVQVQVSDNGDTPLSATQDLTITITPVDEAPALSPTADIDVAENATEVTTVVAIDADAGAAVTYQITGGADAAMFNIDSVTGELTFIDAPDFEAPHDQDANNTYIVQVQADDGAFAVTQTLTINVTNVNEAPSLTSATNFSIAENTAAVTTLTAGDPDANTTFAYTILGGADAALFAIDVNTGELSFQVAPDFEVPADHDGDNTYQVQVQVSDTGETPLSATQDLIIAVTPVNEAPALPSTADLDVAENTTEVTTVVATDADAGAVATYSIVGGADAALFSIDSVTGVLTFIDAPDFEMPKDQDTDNTYIVQVQADDGGLTATQTLTVTVTHINEAPAFTSAASFEIPEHATIVATLTARDPDAGAALTYTIRDAADFASADAAAFTIEPDTGHLTFIAPPDYEAPHDADGDNIYRLQVQVTDGEHETTLDLAVTVTDLLELTFRQGSPAAYADAMGQQVVLGLAGAGEGVARFGPELGHVHVELAETNAGSTFAAVVLGAVPGSTTALSSILASGDLGVISAAAVNLTGDLTVEGHSRAIALGDITDAAVSLGGTAAQATAMVVSSIADSSITSGSGIGRLVVRDAWLDTDLAPDTLSAPWVWNMSVAGQMQASLDLTGAGAPRGYALGALSAGNIQGGRYNLQAGSIGSLTAGGIDGLTLDVAEGVIGRLVSRGDVNGLNLKTGHMNALGVVGDLTAGDVHLNTAGGTGIRNLVVTGRIVGTTLESAGHVLAFQAGGMTDSRLLVGVTPEGKDSPDRLPDALTSSFIASRPVLVSATIRGSDNSGLLRSQIAAARIGRLAIVGEIAGDAGSSVSGAAADQIDLYTDYNPLTQAIRRGVKLLSPSDAETQLGDLPDGMALRIA